VTLGVTVDPVELVPVEPALVTVIFPDPVGGTVAVMRVADVTVNNAVVPSIFTDDVPVNPVPVMTILVPIGPVAGWIHVIVGGAALATPDVTMSHATLSSVHNLYSNFTPPYNADIVP